MAKRIRIVTDSSAQFIDATIAKRYGIMVVPQTLQIGDQLYREGVDIDTETFFRKLNDSKQVPTLIAPTIDQFVAVYSQLQPETDVILSLHISRQMNDTWQNAKNAAQSLLGGTEIIVLDSQTVSVGLGMLVELAVKMAVDHKTIDEIVRDVRSMSTRIYSIFFTETMEYLKKNALISESQAILGTMLGIKPFVTIEDGELMTMEKVRTRSQALDKLVEFVSEFIAVEQIVIVQSTSHLTDATRSLLDRLANELKPRRYPVVVYKPSLVNFIGTDAIGMFVYEREMEPQESLDRFESEEDDF